MQSDFRIISIGSEWPCVCGSVSTKFFPYTHTLSLYLLCFHILTINFDFDITVQPLRSIRSWSLVILARPSTSSSLRITDRSFQYASPRLWNQLTASLRQPLTNLSNSDSPSPMSGTSSIGSIDSPLSSSITHHSFIPVLKPSFSANSFPP